MVGCDFGGGLMCDLFVVWLICLFVAFVVCCCLIAGGVCVLLFALCTVLLYECWWFGWR